MIRSRSVRIVVIVIIIQLAFIIIILISAVSSSSTAIVRKIGDICFKWTFVQGNYGCNFIRCKSIISLYCGVVRYMVVKVSRCHNYVITTFGGSNSP